MADHSSDLTPSDNLLGFFRTLHPVTQGLVWVVLLHVSATLVWVIGRFQLYDMQPGSELLTAHLADHVRSLSYSLLLFGTPATVEFLYRISVEVGLMRRAKGDTSTRS